MIFIQRYIFIASVNSFIKKVIFDISLHFTFFHQNYLFRIEDICLC